MLLLLSMQKWKTSIQHIHKYCITPNEKLQLLPWNVEEDQEWFSPNVPACLSLAHLPANTQQFKFHIFATCIVPNYIFALWTLVTVKKECVVPFQCWLPLHQQPVCSYTAPTELPLPTTQNNYRQQCTFTYYLFIF